MANYKRKKMFKKTYKKSKTSHPITVPNYLTKKQYRFRGKKDKLVTRVIKDPSQIVPDRLVVPMRWHSIYHMTIPTGAEIQYAWRANSVYDPDQVVGIGQKSAREFANMMRLYGLYRVYASAIKVRVINTNSATDNTILAAVYPSDQLINTTAVPNAKSAADLAYAKYCVCAPHPAGKSEQTIPNYISMRKILGDNMTDIDTNYTGNAGSDPPNVVYWNFAADCGGFNTGNATVTVDVEIVYYTEFFDRQLNAP